MACVQLVAESVSEDICLPFVLLPPPPDTLCPITYDQIGSNDYHPPDDAAHPKNSSTVLLTHHAYAHLLCMELIQCRHAFDARALVSHFLCNGLVCPLCRMGDPRAVFDVHSTFKNWDIAPWVIHSSAEHLRRKRQRISISAHLDSVLVDNLFMQPPSSVLALVQQPQPPRPRTRGMTRTANGSAQASSDNVLQARRVRFTFAFLSPGSPDTRPQLQEAQPPSFIVIDADD